MIIPSFLFNMFKSDDNNKWFIGSTIVVAGCIPLAAYCYEYIKKTLKNRNYKEFGQDILPLEVTVENIKNGYKDRPYMPFRYPYHQTMSLVKMDMNHWSIIDYQYFQFLSAKNKVFENYNEEKLKESIFYKRFNDSRSNDVFQELCDFVVDHYTHRYPKLFTKNGNKVYNHLLDEEYDLNIMDPFLVVTKISMEDYYIVNKDPNNDDRQTCIGVSVAFGGGGFPIVPVVGQVMDEVHGKVPYYESKLKKSMNKWFDKFVEPVERASWHFVWDLDLTCSEIYSKLREMDKESYVEYIETIPFEKFEVRIERQTLIKLPKTEAIIFANHPIYINIKEEIEDEPGIPSILLKMLYESPEGIIKSKHFEEIREHIAPSLQEMIDKQILNGLIKENDKIRTPDSFPFASWFNSPGSFSIDNGFIKPNIMSAAY